MAKLSKRLKKLKSAVDFNKSYSVAEAIKLIKEHSSVKFVETLDVAVALGVDSQKSDQLVRGVSQLPGGTGKTVRVAVFATGDKAKEATEAGADVVGAADLVEEVAKGNINFDKCIATPDMMLLLGKVAKVLGPKGLMPNAKLGSVTVNVKDAVTAAKGGQVEFRAEKGGIVHCGVGKLDFADNVLEENVKALLDSLIKAKPAASKGLYLRRAYLSSTMGFAVRVDLSSVVKVI